MNRSITPFCHGDRRAVSNFCHRARCDADCGEREIPIANQEARCLGSGKGFSELLRRPGGRRMGGESHGYHASSLIREHDEDAQKAQWPSVPRRNLPP
jgi:hypothetical protein